MAALSLASPSSAGVHEVAGSALLSEAVETPFLLIFQNVSIITEKGVIIGLLTETMKQNILFPQENNLKVKGNPNRNSRSSVEKYIKREGGVKGGNTAPESLWGQWNPRR